MKIFLKKIINFFKKKKQEFSSINSISQLYQSSLINLPKYIFDKGNSTSIDTERTNQIISTSNTVMDLTNIIIQISLRRGKDFNDSNNNLLNIFADLGRNFTTVLSKDGKDLYISGSILDYINFFKYTRDYGNPYVKAILKEINENTYKQPFISLINDEFMNEKKFLVSYEHDTEIEPISCGHSIKILEENDFEILNSHFFNNKINAYEIGKLCCITIQFDEDFIQNNSSVYNRLLRIAKAYYFSSIFTVLKFSYTDLLEFFNSKKFKSLDIKEPYKNELYLIKKNILKSELFFDEDLFTPRYKLEQINPADPDEILETEEQITNSSKEDKKQISKEDLEKNMENYINNIDNPNALTNINLDNFYDEDDEEFDPENFV